MVNVAVLLGTNRLLNGSDVTYLEIRESDESVVEGLEVFEVSSFSLNRSCISKATERSVTILNTTYSVCVLPGTVELVTHMYPCLA